MTLFLSVPGTGGNNSKELNTVSADMIQDFIDAGGGYLGGHDTANEGGGLTNLTSLAENNINMYVEPSSSIPFYGQTAAGNIDLNVVKIGSLVNFPWALSGSTLTVPSSHSTGQFAMGNIWLNYATSSAGSETTSYGGHSGSSNFYLTTWNNCAMIQTGHSNGVATNDEKKILANTLLYLSQISTATSFDDHTAQDVTAPDSIADAAVSVSSDKKATVTFSAPSDNGNEYQYQLKSISLADDSVYWSPTENETITSGIQGYAVTVDQSLSTDPGSTITSASPSYTSAALTNGTWYVHINVIDREGNVSSTFTKAFTVTDEESSGHSNHDSAESGGAPVIVNGSTYTAGTALNSEQNGKTLTTVTVDSEKLNRVLSSQGDNPSVIVPVMSGSDISTGILTGQMVKDMEQRAATLTLSTAEASYTLPAGEIDIDAVSKKLGSSVELKDIAVSVEIAAPPSATVQIVEDAAVDGGYRVMLPALDFNISCTYNNKTVDVDLFNVYVQRKVLVPDNVDWKMITTGVVVKPDGASYHVPTQITEIDGKYYAVINSLTNSTYAVVWHPVEFSDVASHWAKTAVNDMGSRMVVNGVGDSLYEPDRNITRAEFAAIVVRALGLDAGMGANSFTDVHDSDWFNGFIGTAVEYGIISGYGDGTFGPSDSITREQAMTMISRAMKLTGIKPDLTGTEATALLAGYHDADQSSEYATTGIADCLKTSVILGRSDGMIAPKEYITRAEVATIIQRLLQKSDLI